MNILSREKTKEPDDFWREYEEKTGEKILGRGLGQYLSGWKEFDSKGWNNIWGLFVASSNGFRFHHFPRQNLFEAFFSRGDSQRSDEKTIAIPKEKIISAELKKESRWWAKIFKSNSPKLVIRYKAEAGSENELSFEADFGAKELAENLNSLL